jgi:hypothetical protein
MKDSYPDQFRVSYEVKNRAYLFNLKWEDNHLSLKQFSNNNPDIQEYITPNSDEWDEFWHRMDEIEIWGWYEEYQVKCADSCVEGDEWEVNIEWDDDMIESYGSNSYPPTFQEFLKAVEELTGIIIEFIYLDS